VEWWVIAIGVGAGYLADRAFAKAGWEAGTLVAWGIGLATILGVGVIGYAVQKDDCEAWRERVFERADEIYNPATMTEDEATGIAFDSMERFRPTFC
jgi:hypothetical protein